MNIRALKPVLLCGILLFPGLPRPALAQAPPPAAATAPPAAPPIPAPAIPAAAVAVQTVPVPATPTPATPAATAQAATTAPPAATLAAAGDPPWTPYATMRRALLVFEREHALAPEAEARFELRPQTAAASLAGLRLELAQDADTRTYLPVMADATFSLPDNARDPRGAAILVLNRPAGAWRWRPSVRSPDVPAGARRLGDLRLECRMLLALQAEPGAAEVDANPCQQAGASMPFPAPQPLAAATLTAGARRLALPLGPGGASYAAPLADPAWPDAALLYFDVARAAAAAR